MQECAEPNNCQTPTKELLAMVILTPEERKKVKILKRKLKLTQGMDHMDPELKLVLANNVIETALKLKMEDIFRKVEFFCKTVKAKCIEFLRVIAANNYESKYPAIASKLKHNTEHMFFTVEHIESEKRLNKIRRAMKKAKEIQKEMERTKPTQKSE